MVALVLLKIRYAYPSKSPLFSFENLREREVAEALELLAEALEATTIKTKNAQLFSRAFGL